MIYLTIFLAVAGAGIGILWLHQRRQRSHLHSVNGFRSDLERITAHQIVLPDARPTRQRAVPSKPGGKLRPEPLDPERREAARRRLERRRAAGSSARS
ncbi:MAG: hypothetical protein QOG04_1550 [Actinomycetota bacterium]|nr:hypothetical protein [Actinomycetota bacterium]